MRSFGIAITGESSLQELIHGPNSEVVCSMQIVVQGLGRDFLREQVEVYAKTLGGTN